MVKSKLQTKIVLSFVSIVLVSFILIGVISYINIIKLYETNLKSEINLQYSVFANEFSGDVEKDIILFKKWFLNNDFKNVLLLDKEYNVIVGNVLDNMANSKFIVETNLIKYILEDNFYIKVSDIKDISGNNLYYVYMLNDNVNMKNQLKEYIHMIIVIIIVVVMAVSILAIVISKSIILPINKLRRNLFDIISGNLEDIQDIPIYGQNDEISDLINKFKSLTNKLNDNVNEVSSQKAQIETILLHMSDGVMAFDIYGNLIYQNPAALRLLNINVENKRFDEIFKKLNVEVNLEKIIFLQELTTSEKMLNIGDVYVNLYFEPFKNEEEVIGGVIVLLQDITKQVKLDDMRKEFVANVSHELKTPITTIKSYAEAILEDNIEGETQRKFVSVISQEAQRMARLIADLLQLSRFDINKTQNKQEKFDLGELVKSTYDKISIEAEKRGHEVECYVTANVPLICADKDGIEQVILNIISNSIKYTPDYGKIKIYVGFVYNHAYIKVIDNGIGISKKDLPRVFERFYTADKARSREQGGTGLGLAIAKEIVERNNGSIDITSELGKGTEIIIRLPVKQENNN